MWKVKDICPSCRMIRTNTAFLDFILVNQDHYPEGSVQELSIKKGQQLIRQRSSVNAVSIVKEGIAKCFLYQEDGTDFILEFFGPGEVVGEIEMLNNEMSFAAVEAITPITVLRISRDWFNELLTNDPVFNHYVLKLLAGKVKYKATRFSFAQTHTVEQTLKKMLIDMPDLLEVISKKDLVSYLGITERSLNRTLKSLKDNGQI
ncbi:MAG: Crp/Fnr family transcriptional regulator [Bacteroidota bacterium]